MFPDIMLINQTMLFVHVCYVITFH